MAPDATSLETLFDLSQDMMCIATFKGRFLRVNSAFERVLGHSAEEFLRRPFLDFVHPDDQAATRRAVAALVSGREPRDFHDRYQRADGTYCWLQWRAVAVPEERLIYGVARDVTEARRAALLMERTHRAARVGGWDSDFESGELHWTDETYRLHAVTPATYQPTFETAIAFYVPSSRPIIAAAIERARSTGEPWDLELELVRADGRAIWVRATGEVRREGGRIVGVCGTFHDITAERESRILGKRFLSVCRATPDFVGFAQPDGRVLYVNESGMRLIGSEDPAAWEQMTVADFHPPWAGTLMSETAFPTAAREGVWAGEGALACADGSEIPVSQVILAHRDEHGEVEFLSTVMRDLRPHKALETQLLHSQKMEAIGRLAGGIAHDFNNLLTAILGNAEMALRSLPEDSPCRNSLAAIRQSGERAAELTGQLLAFARSQVIEPRVMEVNALIRGMESLMRPLLGQQVCLTLDLEHDVGHVRVDPGQFEQMLLNLVVNARDAMPSGGNVTIETLRTTHGTAGCAVTDRLPAGAYVDVLVSDTGDGVDPEVRDRIFEPFFTTKELGKGTGLGLATSLGIVEQNGGMIWLAKSEPGVRTTFRVSFPEAVAEASAPSQEIPTDGASGTETILVVDDQEMVRELAVDGLAAYGYSAIPASEGGDALQIAADSKRRIDLLLTDVMLPGLTGPEIAEQFATLRPGTPVLFASGYAEDAIIGTGTLVEGVNFIQKPYTPESLARAVRRVLDR